MTREIVELGLKYGQNLDYPEGKLPIALRFSAVWQDEPKEPESKPKKAK